MFEFVTPYGLFRTQIHTLRDTLPGVLDGAEGSIHDARIATRRIRELLPLLGDPKRRTPSDDDLPSRFKRLGRSLGRVRDADARLALLGTLEARMPHAAPALVVLRQQRERERLALLRKLVKRLERLEAVRMIEMLDEHRVSFTSSLPRGVSGGTWRRDLGHTLHERATAAAAAIEHATGVYFPRRVHKARIAIKKMRYAMEIAHETGRADRSAGIRELKKAQDLLGDLHDRQELVDNLTETCPADQPEVASQVLLLKQVIDAENHDFHARYLSRRRAILDICHSERRYKMPARSLVAAGALAISSGIYNKLR